METHALGHFRILSRCGTTTAPFRSIITALMLYLLISQGHTFCSRCIDAFFVGHRRINCPLCRKHCTHDDVCPIYLQVNHDSGESTVLPLYKSENRSLRCALSDAQQERARVQHELDNAWRTVQDAHEAKDRMREKLTRARRDVQNLQRDLEAEKGRHAQELSEKSSEIEELRAILRRPEDRGGYRLLWLTYLNKWMPRTHATFSRRQGRVSGFDPSAFSNPFNVKPAWNQTQTAASASNNFAGRSSFNVRQAAYCRRVGHEVVCLRHELLSNSNTHYCLSRRKSHLIFLMQMRHATQGNGGILGAKILELNHSTY